MAPILGIMASQISGHLFPWNASDYESIQTYTVGAGGSATISFNSIPSTYKHLQVRATMLASTTGLDAPYIRYNGDTASNYTLHTLLGEGVQARSQGVASATSINIGGFWFGISGSNPAVSVIDVLDYTSTNKNKTTRVLTGQDNNATYGSVGIGTGLWRSTSAITSITIYLSGSTVFSQYSSFALYGIKG